MPISLNSKITYNVTYDAYNYHDSYYKESRYRVVLSMSIDKMRTSYRGMTSHLTVALRGCKGKINLGVFGQIRAVNDQGDKGTVLLSPKINRKTVDGSVSCPY